MKHSNRKRAHHEIDYIFKDLLPAHGLSERPTQIALSHRMLDAMLDGGIALCDAGTGSGKTFQLARSEHGADIGTESAGHPGHQECCLPLGPAEREAAGGRLLPGEHGQ